MLRTIFVLLIVVVGVVYSLGGAFNTLLFYLWIAYFRPDAWLWSWWFTQYNLSFIVGAVLVVATAFSRERIRLGIGQVLMLLFLLQSLVSALLCPVNATEPVIWASWTDFARKIIVGLVIVTLVTSEARLRLTLIVIAASLSFEGAKQGWAQMIINPGAPNINESPFLGDNNGMAVGMLMLVPIFTALAATSSQRWHKYLARFLVIGVLYRAISTYSRGGFLAAIALGLHYVIRTKRKLRTLAAIAIAVAIIGPVLPPAFWERMGTIRTAVGATDESEIDTSSAGRLHFWRVAVAMANDNPYFGVGFNAYNSMYDRYDFSGGAFGKRRSVHSMWFGLLGEVGWAGLAVFVVLLSRSFYINWKARRLARTRPDLSNLVIYTTALEASLLVFAVGGSFVAFAYNEMGWHFLALTIVLDRLVRERIAQPRPGEVPAIPTAPTAGRLPGSGVTGGTRPMLPRLPR